MVVADRDADRTDAVVSDVEARGRRGVGVVADLTDDGAVERAVETAASALGGVDILVNALGEHLWLAKPFERSTPDDWDALYRVNLLATMRASHAALPLMQARGWGRIVNFSSVEGIRAMPNAAPYTAFKAAIDGFTRSLAVEVDALASGSTPSPSTRPARTRSASTAWARSGSATSRCGCRPAGTASPTTWPRWRPSWCRTPPGGSSARRSRPTAARWPPGAGTRHRPGGRTRRCFTQYFDDDPEANRRRPPMLR